MAHLFRRNKRSRSAHSQTLLPPSRTRGTWCDNLRWTTCWTRKMGKSSVGWTTRCADMVHGECVTTACHSSHTTRIIWQRRRLSIFLSIRTYERSTPRPTSPSLELPLCHLSTNHTTECDPTALQGIPHGQRGFAQSVNRAQSVSSPKSSAWSTMSSSLHLN